MRYAMIMAGGSGTRLWPMSRASLPKQLIPFIQGRSLLQIACDRLDGLVPQDARYICAGRSHQQPILDAMPQFHLDRYLAEPTGRDTLNAVGFAAAVIAQQDPDAIIAVFTADHIIEPIDQFVEIVKHGYALVEAQPNTLVTFGIAPTHPATGYGYLKLGQQLGQPIQASQNNPNNTDSTPFGGARIVQEFKEKPIAEIAQGYHAAGANQYLWNSGMFVWRAQTLLDCIKRYHPVNHAGLMKIANAWPTDQREQVLNDIYPTLPKTSVDFGVMEHAAKDPTVQIAAVPMPLTWLDVGSWPSFAETCEKDDASNAIAAKKHLLMDSSNTLVVSSDPNHLIATIGCDDLTIIHTPQATLVCRSDRAEDIKKLHSQVGEKFGADHL